jgi:hypothetical protein
MEPEVEDAAHLEPTSSPEKHVLLSDESFGLFQEPLDDLGDPDYSPDGVLPSQKKRRHRGARTDVCFFKEDMRYLLAFDKCKAARTSIISDGAAESRVGLCIAALKLTGWELNSDGELQYDISRDRCRENNEASAALAAQRLESDARVAAEERARFAEERARAAEDKAQAAVEAAVAEKAAAITEAALKTAAAELKAAEWQKAAETAAAAAAAAAAAVTRVSSGGEVRAPRVMAHSERLQASGLYLPTRLRRW